VDRPFGLKVSGENIFPLDHIIVATAFDEKGARPEAAAEAVVRLAADLGIRRLLQPLLGSGDGGLDSIETAVKMWGAIKRAARSAGLDTITITTQSEAAFERLCAFGTDSIQEQGERQSSEAGSAETAVSEFLDGQGVTPDEELRRLLLLAGNLGPQRNPDHGQVSTSLMLFALVESGWKATNESPLDKAGQTFVDAVHGSARYMEVQNTYFDGREPKISFGIESPPVRGLSVNAPALLKTACDLAKLEHEHFLRPGHVAAAFPSQSRGRALTHLLDLGIDLRRMKELVDLAVQGDEQPGGPFPQPTGAVRESVHASAATTRPIARRVGGCCYVIDLHPTGCTVMRGTK